MPLAFASAPLSAEQARAESIGYQALAYVGKRLPLQVLCSAAGHYIGTADADGSVSRESVSYFRSHHAAEHACKRAAGSSASTRDVQPPGAPVMNRALPQEVLDQIELENQHFAAAPQAFFEAWKRGVNIAGAEWFGDGTREGLQRATTKWDLRPNMQMLNDALGVLSSGQRMFLSAMVSFYNSCEGGAMLRRCGFEGLSDLGGLDLERRKVIADLTLHYSGW